MGEMACVVFGECVQNRGNGMHYLGQGLVHAEIIDPETGDQIAIGEGVEGELVYTALELEAMPLLRYRSRDHIKVSFQRTGASAVGQAFVSRCWAERMTCSPFSG